MTVTLEHLLKSAMQANVCVFSNLLQMQILPHVQKVVFHPVLEICNQHLICLLVVAYVQRHMYTDCNNHENTWSTHTSMHRTKHTQLLACKHGHTSTCVQTHILYTCVCTTTTDTHILYSTHEHAQRHMHKYHKHTCMKIHMCTHIIYVHTMYNIHEDRHKHAQISQICTHYMTYVNTHRHMHVQISQITHILSNIHEDGQAYTFRNTAHMNTHA